MSRNQGKSLKKKWFNQRCPNEVTNSNKNLTNNIKLWED